MDYFRSSYQYNNLERHSTYTERYSYPAGVTYQLPPTSHNISHSRQRSEMIYQAFGFKARTISAMSSE